MEEADQLCERVAFLSDGRIVALDKPSNLKSVHGENHVNVTLNNGESLSIDLDSGELQKLLSSGQVRTLHSAEATLEEVFIQLAGRRLSE
jgi:ABC-2 type transport system ATP-binding protein